MQLEYFQLVDRVEELDEKKGRIECSAAVPTESTIFEGHFPDYPILPGVLLIEAMAQCSGFMLLSLESFERLPFLLQGVDGLQGQDHTDEKPADHDDDQRSDADQINLLQD